MLCWILPCLVMEGLSRGERGLQPSRHAREYCRKTCKQMEAVGSLSDAAKLLRLPLLTSVSSRNLSPLLRVEIT